MISDTEYPISQLQAMENSANVILTDGIHGIYCLALFWCVFLSKIGLLLMTDRSDLSAFLLLGDFHPRLKSIGHSSRAINHVAMLLSCDSRFLKHGHNSVSLHIVAVCIDSSKLQIL